MHIEYMVTIEDIADATVRALSQKRQLRQSPWVTTAGAAVSAGIIVYFLVSGGPAYRLVFAGVAICIGAVWAGVQARDSQRRRLCQYLIRHYGSADPVRFAVQLTDESLISTTRNTTTMVLWRDVVSVEDTGEFIEMWSNDGGYVSVRKSRFESVEAQEAFLEYARQCFELSRESEPIAS